MPNVVNLAARTPATHRLVVRHRDRPGVLAQVLEAIKAEQINVQEMENIVFEGAEAAVARINLDKAPSGATLDRLRAGNEDIIELNVLEIALPRVFDLAGSLKRARAASDLKVGLLGSTVAFSRKSSSC